LKRRVAIRGLNQSDERCLSNLSCSPVLLDRPAEGSSVSEWPAFCIRTWFPPSTPRQPVSADVCHSMVALLLFALLICCLISLATLVRNGVGQPVRTLSACQSAFGLAAAVVPASAVQRLQRATGPPPRRGDSGLASRTRRCSNARRYPDHQPAVGQTMRSAMDVSAAARNVEEAG